MLEVGQNAKVPCDVSPGPFSDEYLVTFESIDGLISGFVQAHDLIISDSDNGRGFLNGVVEQVDENTVTIKLRGSFFTTNGLAAIAKDRAQAA